MQIVCCIADEATNTNPRIEIRLCNTDLSALSGDLTFGPPDVRRSPWDRAERYREDGASEAQPHARGRIGAGRI